MKNISYIRILAVLMALTMILSLVPTFSAEADKSSEPAQFTESAVTEATIDDFLCEIENGAITITGYIGTETNIRIRDTLGDYPVTKIADEAFKNNENIKVVYIYNSIKTIGESAFENCTALWYVHINGGAKLIGKNAFKNTAFYNQDRFWEDGLLISLGSRILLSAKEDLEGVVHVPYEVVAIAGGAFANCKNIEGIYLYEDKLSIIGNYAFENCENLKGVKTPASVNLIGTGAFSGCEKAEVYAVEETNFIKRFCEYEEIPLNVTGRYATYDEKWDITIYTRDDLGYRIEEAYTEEEIKEIEKYFKGTTAAEKPFKVTLYNPDNGADMSEYYEFTLKIRLKGDTVISIYDNTADNSECPYKAFPYFFDETHDGYVEFEYSNGHVVADINFAYYSVKDKREHIIGSVPTVFDLKSFYCILRNEENNSNFESNVDSLIPEGDSFIYIYAKYQPSEIIRLIPLNAGIKMRVPTEYEKNAAYIYDLDDKCFFSVDCVTKDGFAEFTLPLESAFYYGAVVAGITEDKPAETDPSEPEEPSTNDTVPTEPEEDTKPSTSDFIPTDPAEKTEPTQAPDASEGTTEATTEAVTTPDETQESSSSEAPTETTPDESDYLLGDVNRDGKLNIRDATLIQKYLAKLATLDDEQMIIADITLDKKVNIKDATYIQKKIAKLV